jgi:methylmalonyl-CoA mutase N-terminal domain/subunit
MTPRFYPMNLRATLVYEAGGTSVQEIGFGFACAQAYLDQLVARGADLAKAAARVSFLLFGDTNLLEEACKFRAARMTWAQLLHHRYGVTDPSAQHMRFTVAVGNYNLRAQLPELNLVRNALGALGGVLGGCQGMLVAGMDEAFEIPSEKNSLLGLYTQQVIAYESGVAQTVDPLGGSYYVEATTERLRREITGVMAEIDEAGGAVVAIENGLLQHRIADSAYAVQMAEESGQKLVVGVNTPGSTAAADPDFELHEADSGWADAKRQELARFRHGRDGAAVAEQLSRLRDGVVGQENLVDPIRAALRDGVSVGEIMAVLIGHYGEFEEPIEL